MLPQPDAERIENPSEMSRPACILCAGIGSRHATANARLAVAPLPNALTLPPPGGLRVAQQPTDFHQFVECVTDNFGVVQQMPLLAVDVRNRRDTDYSTEPTPPVAMAEIPPESNFSKWQLEDQ
jgi:hypothetical protein